jgi:hypothetical protein
MYVAKIFLAAVIVFSFALTGAAKAETSPPSTLESNTIMIEVSGKVPGFTQAQLSAYLARKMQGEISSTWHFVEGKQGDEDFSNRVVWSFKSLRKVWEGGTHNGFPAPTHSVTYLRAEVKLYLKGAFQMTMDTHPSVGSGADDKALTEMVHNAAQGMFVMNKPDMP